MITALLGTGTSVLPFPKRGYLASSQRRGDLPLCRGALPTGKSLPGHWSLWSLSTVCLLGSFGVGGGCHPLTSMHCVLQGDSPRSP